MTALQIIRRAAQFSGTTLIEDLRMLQRDLVFIHLAALVLIASTTHAQQKIKLACVGDSITEGHGGVPGK